MQALYLLALDPVAETLADPNSYGFRPGRSTADAIEQCFKVLGKQASPQWILDGDIKGCFDHVNHNILLKKLWKMGIRDKRILMLIKKMLKAGIFQEIEENSLGTPQGGIISPLLANVYLHEFDKYIPTGYATRYKQTSGEVGGDFWCTPDHCVSY